jgi:hypothetical protein
MTNNLKVYIPTGITILIALVSFVSGYKVLSSRVDRNEAWIKQNQIMITEVAILKDYVRENRAAINKIPVIESRIDEIHRILIRIISK